MELTNTAIKGAKAAAALGSHYSSTQHIAHPKCKEALHIAFFGCL